MLWWTLRKLRSPESAVRRQAVFALGRGRDPRAVEPLLAVLRTDVALRSSAAEALGKSGDARAIEPLVALLEAPSTTLGERHAIATALAALQWQPQKDEQRALLAVALENWQGAAALGRSAVGPLLAVLFEADRGRLGDEVLAALRSIGDPAVDGLLVGLQDPKATIVERSAAALGKLASARAVEPLLSLLDRRLDQSVRVAAENAMRQLGDAAIAPLVARLESENPGSRKDAARLLARSGWQPADEAQAALYAVADQQLAPGSTAWWHPAAVGPLLTLVMDRSTSLAVRRKAVEALGRTGDLRALEPLIAVMNDDHIAHQERQLRVDAATALGEIGGAAAGEALLAVVRGLLRIDPQGRSTLREAAAGAIAKLGDRIIQPWVTRLSDERADVRLEAATLLAALQWRPTDPAQQIVLALAGQEWARLATHGELAVGPLLAALHDADPTIRDEAIRVLVRLRDERAVEALVAMLGDERASLACIVALGSLGDPRALAPLSLFLERAPADLCSAAVGAVEEIGGERAEAVLLKVLHRNASPWPVRRKAAQALSRSSWRPAGETEGILAAVALQRWNEVSGFGKAAVEPLLTLLEDADSSMREGAAGALGAIGDLRAIEPLIAVLGDVNSSVRAAAAHALGDIRDSRAIAPLSPISEHDPYLYERPIGKYPAVSDEGPTTIYEVTFPVREAAAQALAKIRGEPIPAPVRGRREGW
jgi:HEAT repeat protein